MDMQRIEQKLSHGERLRVLFINDIGFRHGAGIAQFRQVQSLLLMGHEVMGICWKEIGLEGDITLAPRDTNGCWLGMRELPHAHIDAGCPKHEIVQAIIAEVQSVQPDIVIVGNIHGVKWPLELFLALRERDCVTIAFMHDCYFATGRCGYPGQCQLYQTGCDEHCPSADEYPIVPRLQIRDDWELRREIFCGPHGIPIATNSQWMLDLARQAFRELHYADVVYYGLDERIYRPIKRSLARKLLGIPEECFVVLTGAVNVNEYRKGWHIVQEVIAQLHGKARVLLFGHDSTSKQATYAVGLVNDYTQMPLIYSAANVFVAASLEEAFGQTICEAAACGVPVVAFGVGGIPEIAQDGINAKLSYELNPVGLLEAIQLFMNNPEWGETFGLAGRMLVESQFTLQKQGERWMNYLQNVVHAIGCDQGK